MDTLHMIFFTLLALGLLVTIHEFGHFWVARRCGVKVLRFSIGFGPPLLRRHDRHGTEFVVAALPLGGYVKMLDEREGEVPEQELDQAFNRKSVWQRIAVVAAGPAANFLLAVVVYWVVFLMGVQGVAPIVDEVVPGTAAERAGLEPGQEIVAVDGEATPTWQALNQQLVRRLGESGEMVFTVKYPESSLRYDNVADLQGWDIDTSNPNPVESIGIRLYRPEILPVADQLTPGDPAEAAGMEPGDRILRAAGREIPDWRTWVELVRERPGEAIDVVVERDGREVALTLEPRAVEQPDGSVIGQVGMSVAMPEWPPELIREMHYGPVSALVAAGSETWKTTKLIFDSLRKMITGLISTKHLSGPITIAKVAGASADYGASAYLGFLALLSVSLGVLNLLPVPVLDGGHLMYYFIEVVKGSPVSEKIQMAGYKIGLFLVIGLMVLALYNDVMRL